MVNNEKEEVQMKYQVKEVKISTALYSIAIAKNEKFCKTTVTFLVYYNVCQQLLHYINLVKFWLCTYFTNQPFRLFGNTVVFQFEKSIQVLKNQVWNFDVM